ncbi:MAG: hypothetical protein J4F43_05390 [Dehalococcoidia bacterium]|nr:hypothetical protein [Dehalococcoidia bacterium]
MSAERILLGTTNPAKLEKLRWLLEGLPLEPVSPRDLGMAWRGPDEDGPTHLETAVAKAREWSLAASLPAVSTDGGLVIPALGDGWQSTLTHRFAGEGVDDTTRVSRLLELMAPHSGDGRRASWVEAVAIADGKSSLASWEVPGAAGVLLEAPSGPTTSGFWVFSLWHFPHLGKTYNELEQPELESLDDHWAKLRALVRRFFMDRPPPG